MVFAERRDVVQMNKTLDVQDFYMGGLLVYGRMVHIMSEEPDVYVRGETEWWNEFLLSLASARLRYDHPRRGREYLTSYHPDFLLGVKQLLDYSTVSGKDLICSIY